MFNSFSYLFFSKMLSLLDFTFLSFRPGASLGRGNSFEYQLLTGMFYHCLSRQTGAYLLTEQNKSINDVKISLVLNSFNFEF